VDGLRELLVQMRTGAEVDGYIAGSLALFARELLDRLDAPAVAVAV
jgi:hypothetical protein